MKGFFERLVVNSASPYRMLAFRRLSAVFIRLCSGNVQALAAEFFARVSGREIFDIRISTAETRLEITATGPIKMKVKGFWQRPCFRRRKVTRRLLALLGQQRQKELSKAARSTRLSD
jgi:hypothetical protein